MNKFDTTPAPTLRMSTDGLCPECGWKGHFAGQQVQHSQSRKTMERRTCINCETRYVVRTTEPLARR